MKKLVSIILATGIIAALIPSALADKSDYVGSYYTLNSDAPGYAAIDIESCSDTEITLRFKRIKNDQEAFTYVFETGVVEGDYAAVPFTATITESNATFTGVMTLEFQNKMIDVRVVSSLGSEMYSGHLPKVDRSYFDDSVIPQATATPTVAPTAQPAAATPAAVSEISYDVSVMLNGTKLQFDNSARPLIQNNFTYVPLRSVFSSMGINVYWDDFQMNDQFRKQLITCTKNDTIIQFARTSNNSGANVWTLKKWDNGRYTSDVDSISIDITTLQPIIINNRSYVPLRVISESLGADVAWDDNARTVIINCDTNNAYWYNTDTIGKQEDFSVSDAAAYIPADYTSVQPDLTPYFSPQSKFYLFNASDMYGKVVLRMYYGGYIDVIPATGDATVDTQQANETTDVPAETETPELIQPETAEGTDAETTTAPAASGSEALEQGVTTTVVTDENGNEKTVYTFDLSQILGGTEENTDPSN